MKYKSLAPLGILAALAAAAVLGSSSWSPVAGVSKASPSASPAVHSPEPSESPEPTDTPEPSESPDSGGGAGSGAHPCNHGFYVSQAAQSHKGGRYTSSIAKSDLGKNGDCSAPLTTPAP